MITRASRTGIMAALLVGFGTCASADITWTLNNVSFSDGTTLTGGFTTNAAVNGLDGTTVAANDFTIVGEVLTQLPGEIGFYSSGFAAYVDLAFSSPLTNAGGVIDIVSSSVTYGGHTYFTGDSGQGTISGNANVNGGGGSVPEPSAFILLATVMGVLGVSTIRRRKQQQIS